MADKTKLQAALGELLDEDELFDLAQSGGGDLDYAREIIDRAPHLKNLIRELAEDSSFDWLFPAWESLVLAVDPSLFEHAPAYLKDASGANNYLIELLFLYYSGTESRDWAAEIHRSTALKEVISQMNVYTPEEAARQFWGLGDADWRAVGYSTHVEGMKTLFQKLGLKDELIEVMQRVLVNAYDPDEDETGEESGQPSGEVQEELRQKTTEYFKTVTSPFIAATNVTQPGSKFPDVTMSSSLDLEIPEAPPNTEQAIRLYLAGRDREKETEQFLELKSGESMILDLPASFRMFVKTPRDPSTWPKKDQIEQILSKLTKGAVIQTTPQTKIRKSNVNEDSFYVDLSHLKITKK